VAGQAENPYPPALDHSREGDWGETFARGRSRPWVRPTLVRR
jgi:hypothetical protein